MATKTGISGKVMIGATAIAEITKWSLDQVQSVPKYVSSSKPGIVQRRVGAKDASGTLEGKIDVAANPKSQGIYSGAEATLLLYVDATNFFTVPAIIEDFKFQVNIDGEDVVGWTSSFGATDIITYPTGW